MNIIRNILFFNVVAVIILHTIIPHRHHGEMTNKEHKQAHENAAGVFEIIALSFHQGSSNNLNNYNISEQNSLKKIDFNDLDFFIGVFSVGILSLSANGEQSPTTQQYFISNSFNIQFSGLRGPPDYDYYS